MPNSVRLASDTLVGRDEELRITLAVLRDLPEGRPGVVLVSGPAGIGKTRFVTTVADRLRADRVRVMAGACLDLGAGAPPYSALIGAFRSVDPPAVQVLDALTGAIDMRRSQLFALLAGTTAALAHRRATVVVVEDLHWSDRITRDALLYLLTMAREGRWALLVTFRADEVAARPAVSEFVENLHRDRLASVTLDALPPQGVAGQIAGITGVPPSPEDAERVHRRSGGVPLLVEEVVAAEAAGTAGVPDHLRDLLLSRVRRLGGQAAQAVDVVTVSGDPCGERLVAAVLGTDRDRVVAALDRAVAADVIVADGRGYRMRHELFREAVYRALPPGRRRQLHARIAGVLAADRRPDAAALARHWYEADEPRSAAEANLDAAHLADRVHAPGEVATYLQRVLEHFDALPTDRAAAAGGRAALLVRAAEAAYLSGEFGRAAALAEQCLDEPAEPSATAVRWERLARYRWVSRDGPGAQDAHERSLATLPDDAPASVRAQVLAGYGWYLAMASRPADARSWSQRALGAADASGEALARCRALLAWGYARGDEDAGLAALEAARDLARAADTADELARAPVALDLALRRHGRPGEREQVLREGLRAIAAHGLGRSYEPVMHYLLAEVLIDLGRWDEADAILEAPATRTVSGLPAMFLLAYRTRLAAARGQSSSVTAHADRVATLSKALPQQPIPRAIVLCARAESCLWTGDAEHAISHAEQARGLTDDLIWGAEADALFVRAAADLAHRARVHGQPAAMSPAGAHRVPDQPAALPSAGADAGAAAGSGRQHPRVRAFAATVRAERSRGDGRRDPGPWRDAVAAWDVAGDPYRAAYCRWRLAHARLATRAGRGEAARELDAVHRTAARLGARPLREAVEGLAAAARLRLDATPAAEQLAGPVEVGARLGLTYRESEIVPLLVAGRTNAEIAEALVISPRTVGVHVSHILHKLGATRRTEAADIARRRGLVSD